MPSVTTARITEHNRGSAAVMPAPGKQQEAVVVDSAAMKLALRQPVTSPLWPPQHIYPHCTPGKRRPFLIGLGPILGTLDGALRSTRVLARRHFCTVYPH